VWLSTLMFDIVDAHERCIDARTQAVIQLSRYRPIPPSVPIVAAPLPQESCNQIVSTSNHTSGFTSAA
jgi:hypothetical protein